MSINAESAINKVRAHYEYQSRYQKFRAEFRTQALRLVLSFDPNRPVRELHEELRKLDERLREEHNIQRKEPLWKR